MSFQEAYTVGVANCDQRLKNIKKLGGLDAARKADQQGKLTYPLADKVIITPIDAIGYLAGYGISILTHLPTALSIKK